MVCLFSLQANAAAEVISGLARVTDGDTIEVGEEVVRLFGVDAPELGQKCKGPKELRHCGKLAATFLADRIEGEHLECVVIDVDEHNRSVASCRHDGEDLSGWLVREGYALAFLRYSDRYIADEAMARAGRLGLWRAALEPPWKYRARRWKIARQEAPEGCPIKGNISRATGDRIYHTPWSRSYDSTKISVEKGERWFCTEEEALAAGWRPPNR